MSVRILSIDGGGIRGFIAAYWLKMLEKRLKTELDKSLHDVFDVFAGASTGAIIAAGLACNDFDAQKIYDLYRQEGAQIFKPQKFLSVFPAIRPTCGIRPKYQSAGLESVLQNKFQKRLLGDVKEQCHKRLLIIAFDAFKRRPAVFDSADPAHAEVPLHTLCRASAAAPTYFAPAIVNLQGIDVPLLDGGVAANNPSIVALARVMHANGGWPGALIVSVGTGAPRETIKAAKVIASLRKRGLFRWARPIVGMLFDGSSAVNEDVVGAILPSNSFRFQTKLSIEQGALDNTSKKNLDDLEVAAAEYWQDADTQNKVELLIQALNDKKNTSIAGKWKSAFTWADPVPPRTDVKQVTFQDPAEDFITIRQAGNMFSGETDDAANPPYRYIFHGKIVGDHDLIGEWKGSRAGLTGTFQLRRDATTNKLCRGFWSGSGNGDLYVGTWTWQR